MPSSENFRFQQIRHFLTHMGKDKPSNHAFTPYEIWCGQSTEQRGGISIIYQSLSNQTTKTPYMSAWESDLSLEWDLEKWRVTFSRAYKSILNISLVESSVKVITRWGSIALSLDCGKLSRDSIWDLSQFILRPENVPNRSIRSSVVGREFSESSSSGSAKTDKTSASQKDSHNFKVPSTMSAFLAIVLLSLNMGKSGGAIKPVVTFTPNWGNVLYYDSVTLTCDVPSTVQEESQTYHWYKDNQPIPGDQQRLHIIRSLVVEDKGDYQCRTIGGDISDPVFLNVTYNYVILQRPPSAIYEGDPLTLRCHHVTDFNSINTKFYKDDQEIKSSESDSTFHIPNIMINQSGLYKCTKQIHHKDESNVQKKSDVSFISVKDKELPVAVIAAAVIGSLVVIVVSAVLIWKWKKIKSFSHQDPHQAIPTYEITCFSPPGKTMDPNPQDVCYTYLDISRLPKGTGIKHDDLTVTYATVNNANI
ncbi:low affinity immunoglobulin gamma Fc region receptor II-c-like [Aquarana catesbeiana]|uniref:low affinity immunoglobulin gamma Fc region receptor II-c-like n=1 Tax=Aquarana catesbeiana TaxID=8400 RepID=UPI003CC9A0BF